MMLFSSVPRFAFLTTVLAACALSSCSSSGPVDVRYPTVQQMDDLDVQWGLPRRKSRGTPTRSYAYDSSTGAAAPVSSAPQAPALPDPLLEPAPSSFSPAAPATNPPAIPDQLR